MAGSGRIVSSLVVCPRNLMRINRFPRSHKNRGYQAFWPIAAISIFAYSCFLFSRNGRTLDTKCGAESLYALLRSRGKPANLLEIESEFPKSTELASMEDIQAVGEKHGLQLTGWELTPSELLTRRQSGILSVHGQHFVALVEVRDEKCFVIDLQVSPLRQVWNATELDHNWNGIALLVQPSSKAAVH
jgi:ABC-type bacteriocin/lantibiotic exporter with double-glycine peptidase domain